MGSMLQILEFISEHWDCLVETAVIGWFKLISDDCNRTGQQKDERMIDFCYIYASDPLYYFNNGQLHHRTSFS